MTLAARLAARPGSACLLAFGERLPGGEGYVLHVRPLPAAVAGESGTRRMNRALESLIPNARASTSGATTALNVRRVRRHRE